uniref:MOSC domain-containing protein n=1 Tax=Periophthalmus magnuspinnatus TaxID=409849 RepID=A0A3B4B8W8_9GOBI
MELRAAAVNALSQHRKAALLIGGAGAALLGLAVGYKYLRKPEKLVRVGVVSQLLVHPLKSGKALSVALAECLRTGLKFGELQDRHWMVVTEDGHMVTGRQEPRLVLMTLTCEGGQICLNGPNMEELKFPKKNPQNRVIDCRVFGADIQGRDCGDAASSWITRYFKAEKTYRLVHFEPHMKARKPEPLFPKDEEVAYPDFAPVMILSEASVKDLSSKLDKPVTVERFRPNIIISDCEPFDEDSWEEIQIGSVRLKRVMACGRCLFTTVDPETGVISRKEPLDTLKIYRLCDPSEKHLYKSSPLFGQLLTVNKTGILQVGDEVFKIVR